MAVTANAFDTVTIDYEGESPAVDWTTSNDGRFTASIAEDGGNHYMNIAAVGNGNNGTNLNTNGSYIGTVSANTDFTMIMDLALTPTGNGGSNQSAATFTLKSANANAYATDYILKIAQNGSTDGTWTINGDASTTVKLTSGKFYTYKITRKGTVTYLTVTDGADSVFTQKIIANKSENGGIGGMRFDTSRYSAGMKIDNITIRDVDDASDIPSVATYKVTTNCVASDDVSNVVKSSAEYVEEGTEYTPSYDATFDDDSYRYTYVSGGDQVTITGETTITLVYSKAALADHTVTVKAIGDLDKTLLTDTVKDAKDYKYAFSKYILEGTTLYTTGTSGTNDYYHNTVSNVTDDVVSNISYTEASENVVYYSDGADANGLTAVTGGNVDIRCSNGKGGYAASNATITTLPAGKYKITMAAYGNQGTTFKAYAGSTDTEALVEAATSSYITPVTSDEFTLTEDTAIIIGQTGNGGSSPKILDYIYIEKTGEYVPPVTTTEAGYVFESVISDLKAASKVTLKVTASNGEKTAPGSVDITDKLANITTNDLMLAVILTDVPNDVTITSASIVVE
jgi:hypothetical protein